MTFPDLINTCYATTSSLRILAQYSHVIPIVFSMTLGLFVAIKARFNLFSRIFLMFVSAFSLWLVFDLVLWTSNNYFLIYTLWSTMVYIEIVFFILGFYFAILYIRGSDIPVYQKILLFLLTIFPFIITISGRSVLGFDHAICNAINNSTLDTYKLVVEILMVFIMFLYTLRPFIKKLPRSKKISELVVLGSMVLALSVFGYTEYISGQTGNYIPNLYSLFILPFFFLAMTYAVFELDIFNFKILGTYYLVAGFIVLMCGQLFFIAGKMDAIITVLTLVLSLILSFIIFKNLKRETEQRIRIEKLSQQLEETNTKIEKANSKLEITNDRLKSLDKLKTEFLSLAAHQLRSPLTAIRGYTSMLLEGDFGKIGDKQKEAVDRVYQSSSHLTKVVEDLLNVSKIEAGGMKYTMTPYDIEKSTKDLTTDLSVTAKNKGLEITFDTDKKGPYMINGDMEKIRQVVLNVIDNAIKYTQKGSIKVFLSKDEKANVTKIAVTDTGMGISSEEKEKLFQKFSRGEGGKTNTSGSGLGLYLAKQISEAHGGRIMIDSPGVGLGSTFTIELKTMDSK